ncbi:anti-CBASS protein Acb1 family protein [Halobacterium hubeiense]|uniref:anti-CBASS protein Acb1 family protein n=1 Tax=Halobacterium hubeiense TaxID=1407499 RepID=UPI001C4EA6D4|nr:anti-CBASS Acb1 family protein [Halobacterium hubeiense]
MTGDSDSDTSEDANSDAGDVVEMTGDQRPEVSDEIMELVAAEQVDMAMRQVLEDQLGENIDAEGIPDYYDVFDWDPNPTSSDYYAMAMRNPYAFAVTFLPSMTSWRDAPQIVDDADTTDDTDFESKLDKLVRNQDLWKYASRGDMLAGIGTFGLLVLEFDDVEREDIGDGEDNEGFGTQVNDPQNLTGIKPYSRESIEDVRLGGPGSGRWGQPLEYQLDLGDENDEEFGIERGGPDTMWVHHSRVIHIHSDQLLDDEIRGIPRQQPVFNNIVDIEKTLGSAGELAYRASAWGININIDKDFDIEQGGEKLQKHLARWQSGLENVLRTHGADQVQSLGGEDIDPGPVIDPNVEAISAQTGIPQSVLKGNETGERATTQDLKEWYGKIQERRQEFVTPTIVRALIDRLIQYNILPTPEGGVEAYSVEWEPLHEMSAKDISEVRVNRSKAVKNVQSMIPGMTTEQVVAWIEDGEFPEFDDVDIAGPEEIDESDEQVQAYLEEREARAARAETDGGEDVEEE